MVESHQSVLLAEIIEATSFVVTRTPTELTPMDGCLVVETVAVSIVFHWIDGHIVTKVISLVLGIVAIFFHQVCHDYTHRLNIIGVEV